MYAPLSSDSADEIDTSRMSSVKILSSLIADGLRFKLSSSGFPSKIFRMVELKKINKRKNKKTNK
jgi:hypothetical protein